MFATMLQQKAQSYNLPNVIFIACLVFCLSHFECFSQTRISGVLNPQLDCDLQSVCSSVPWTEDEIFISLLPELNCSILARYRFRESVINQKRYIQMELIGLGLNKRSAGSPTGWVCPEVWDRIHPFANNPSAVDEEFFNYLWKLAYEKIMIRSFTEAYLSLDPNLRPNFDCPNTQFEIHGIEGSCLSLDIACINTGVEGEEFWQYKYNKCKQSCCVYEYSICFNTTTGQVERNLIQFSEVTNNTTNCEDIAAPQEVIPNSMFRATLPCKFSCGQ